MWYRRSFTLPEELRGRRILLHFGAVDFSCAVYVNGQQAGTHRGGYTPFQFDITPLLRDGENDLCLRVEDAPDCTQPRGKQYWDRGLMGCWYTPVTGIWQTVYLEAAGETALRQIHITPDIDHCRFTAEIILDGRPAENAELELDVFFQGKLCRTVRSTVADRTARITVDLIVRGDLDPVHLWSPGSPNLYDLRVRLLENGRETDAVSTYFGMRKVEVKDG